MKRYLAYLLDASGNKLYWLGANPLLMTPDRKYAVRFNSIELLNVAVGDFQFLIEPVEE